jgi:hypothetical protein
VYNVDRSFIPLHVDVLVHSVNRSFVPFLNGLHGEATNTDDHDRGDRPRKQAVLHHGSNGRNGSAQDAKVSQETQKATDAKNLETLEKSRAYFAYQLERKDIAIRAIKGQQQHGPNQQPCHDSTQQSSSSSSSSSSAAVDQTPSRIPTLDLTSMPHSRSPHGPPDDESDDGSETDNPQPERPPPRLVTIEDFSYAETWELIGIHVDEQYCAELLMHQVGYENLSNVTAYGSVASATTAVVSFLGHALIPHLLIPIELGVSAYLAYTSRRLHRLRPEANIDLRQLPQNMYDVDHARFESMCVPFFISGTRIQQALTNPTPITRKLFELHALGFNLAQAVLYHPVLVRFLMRKNKVVNEHSHAGFHHQLENASTDDLDGLDVSDIPQVLKENSVIVAIQRTQIIMLRAHERMGNPRFAPVVRSPWSIL